MTIKSRFRDNFQMKNNHLLLVFVMFDVYITQESINRIDFVIFRCDAISKKILHKESLINRKTFLCNVRIIFIAFLNRIHNGEWKIENTKGREQRERNDRMIFKTIELLTDSNSMLYKQKTKLFQSLKAFLLLFCYATHRMRWICVYLIFMNINNK